MREPQKPDDGKLVSDDTKIIEKEVDKTGTPSPEPGKVVDHPKFQERIDQFTARLDETQQSLKQEKVAREQGQQAFNTLSKQYAELTETLNQVEDKVSINEAPNYDDDPKGYMDWQQSRTLQSIEKMLKTTSTPTPATPANPTSASQTPPPIPVQEAAMAALHDDYYQVIAEANKDMKNDPALDNAIFDTTNPYKTAYEYGIRKKKVAEDLRQGNLSQGYVESGTTTVQDTTRLTPEQKTMVANMKAGGANITEESYLKSLQKIAKRRGK